MIFTKYENFFPLVSLDLRSQGIEDKIHIIYVSFNYNGVETDSNFPDGDDMDHFTFQIEKNGLYRPTFKKKAMNITDKYLPYFNQTKEKYQKLKSKKFDVTNVLQMYSQPNWLQHDATPINSKGEKFKFICQFELETFAVDDSWLYVFYDKYDRQVKYVHQRT